MPTLDRLDRAPAAACGSASDCVNAERTAAGARVAHGFMPYEVAWLVARARWGILQVSFEQAEEWARWNGMTQRLAASPNLEALKKAALLRTVRAIEDCARIAGGVDPNYRTWKQLEERAQ